MPASLQLRVLSPIVLSVCLLGVGHGRAAAQVEVTPDGASAEAPAQSSSGVSFTVHNPDPADWTYSFSCSVSGAVTFCSAFPGSAFVPSGGSTNVSVSFSTGAPGSGTVSLYAEGEPGECDPFCFPASGDEGWYNVTVTPSLPMGPPAVTLKNQNGENVDRSVCLTSGAGEAAAWQCGDLLVAHSLPGYSTMGRTRSLTLVYNSAQAAPRPVVAALVDVSNVMGPNSIYAELRVNGAVRSSATYNGWGTAPFVRQIALAYDASTDSTGVYPFTFTVRNLYSSSAFDTTLSGNLIVVNRSQSEFGQGWWLAGVEQLFFVAAQSILRVGADASAELYRPVEGDAGFAWVAPAGGFRDTIIFVPGIAGESEPTYRRRLRQRTEVVFNTAGRHIQTITPAGLSTDFNWTGTRLTSLAVPPAGEAGTVYTLAYESTACSPCGNLDRITDPAGRVLDVTVNGGRLTSATDPDGLAPTFAYDAAGRMTARTSRRGFTTRFVFAKGLRVDTVKVPLNPASGDTARIAFEPWDEKGLATGSSGQNAVDSALAHTKIDGPRVDSADVATFWVDRFGAPVRTRDPYGFVTTVDYGDPRFPLLPTRVKSPNGRIVGQSYDASGNLIWQADSTHVAGVAVDSFRYDLKWNRVSAVIRPLRDSITFGYDPNSGNAIWMRDAQGNQSDFRYESGTDLIRAICAPGCFRPDSFEYNALGRLTRALSPLHAGDSFDEQFYWRFDYDAQGNRTLTIDPRGLLTNAYFSVMNLDTLIASSPCSLCGNDPGNWREIKKWYNAAGAVDSLQDPIGLRYRWTYDAAGRMTRKVDAFGNRDSLVYDAAANVIEEHTRRGHVIRNAYDRLNRLRRKILPGFQEPRALAGGALLTIPGDTLRFSYDAVGNIQSASDRDTKVERQYNLEGTLASETQRIASGSWQSPNVASTPNVYTWGFAYDPNSRPITTSHPVTVANAAIPGYTGTTRYIYGTQLSTLGRLEQVIGVAGDAFRFVFDTRARPDSLIYPNSVRQSHLYDDADRLLSFSGVRGGTTVYRDTFVYDKVGSVTFGKRWREHENVLANPDSGVYAYDGFHRLLSATFRSPGTYEYEVARYRYDLAGNRLNDSIYSPTNAFAPTWSRYLYESGRLREVDFNAGGGWQVGRLNAWNADGSLSRRNMRVGSGVLEYQYFYDAKGELMRVEWERDTEPNRTFVEFFFKDPFGRRVLTKEEDPTGVNGVFNTTFTFRMLYVGQDRVEFIRSSTTSHTGINSSDGAGRVFTFNAMTSAPIGSYGHIFYTGTPLDERGGNILYHHRDRQGTVVQKTDVSGHVPLEYRNDRRLLPVDFTPFGIPSSALTSSIGDGYTGAPHDNGRFGLVYLRNRYYDPETGRFTQEDPIGFAGGINLYAYVGNNPASYTDPFGLCPPEDDNFSDCEPGTSEWYANRLATGEGNTVLNFAGGVLATCGESIECMTALLPMPPVAGAAGRVGKALDLAKTAVGNVTTKLGSKLEATIAGRIWTAGGRTIRAARGAGPEIGRVAGDNVYRAPQIKPPGHVHAGELVGNLENKATGANVHLLIRRLMWW